MPKVRRQTRLNHWTKDERNYENQWGNLSSYLCIGSALTSSYISDFINGTSFKITVAVSNDIVTTLYFQELLP